MRLRAAAACLILVAVAGCSSEEPASGDDSQKSIVEVLPQPTTGPYVSVAVDNHFHDIHPEDHIKIAADRTFIVKNEGRNLHNFTIPAADFTRDIRPGHELVFDPVGKRLPPGTYTVFCKYHASQGMVGKFTVVKE
jgi:Cupredoxin-like domain